MDKKAQVAMSIGIIMMTFVTVLVGVILFQAVAQEAGVGTSTPLYNTSAGDAKITMGASGITIDLTGQEYISGFTLFNASDDAPATNYTISEGVSTTTGVKTITLTTTTNAEIAGEVFNATYTYGPDGYINNSGARSMVSLIAIFFALAIAVVALEPTLRSGVLNSFK